MNKIKLLILVKLIFLLAACNTVKEGFSSQRKNNSDEFLVEKKSPLVMPPDYNELPIPNDEKTEKETKDIKSLISKSKQEEINEDLNKKNSSFEGSILKKIKKN